MIRSPRKLAKRDYKALNIDGNEGASPSKRLRKSQVGEPVDGHVDVCNRGAHQSPGKSGQKSNDPKKLRTPQRSPVKSPLKSPESVKSPLKSPKCVKYPLKSPKCVKSPLKSPKCVKSPLKSPKCVKSPQKTPDSVKSLQKSPKSVNSPLKSLSLFDEIKNSKNHGGSSIKSSDEDQMPRTPKKSPQKSAAMFYGSPRKTPQKNVRVAWFGEEMDVNGPPTKSSKRCSLGMDALQVKQTVPTMPKRKPVKVTKSVGDREKLYDDLPCRDKQIDLLLSLFGERDDEVWPSLFLYGHTATGKTKVVTAILENQQLPHVIVNLVECYTNKLMYEHILNSISGEMPSPENDYATYARCDNMNDFVICFKRAVKERELKEETVYIVLDHAERLRDMDAYILPAFTRLQELTQCKVCVVLISEIVWEKFRFGTGCVEPIVIHFPDYTQDDLMDIMLLDCPEDREEDFYSSYLNLLLSVFYSACRDLRELRHLASLNFPKYIEPISTGEAKESESRKLWRNIEPHLKKALHSVYLREVSSAQWEKMQQQSGDGAMTSLPAPTSRMHVELPYYSKYLLIAAYLASYNPAKSDQRFFTKRAEKKVSRQAQLVKKNERTSSQLLGPKAFPLDRLMAIFYSIVEGKVLPTAYVYSQIASLVTLRLVAHVGGDDQLDGPKYKCVISLDFIKSVSRTVGFEVMRYLYDFI